MKTILVSGMLLVAAANAQAQITTSAPVSTIKSSGTAVALTPMERKTFEASLIAGTLPSDLGGAFPTVPLHWANISGAASYALLRSATFSGAAATIPLNERTTQYNAQVLPGKEFYFRIVARNDKGQAIDTTAAVHVTVPQLAPVNVGDSQFANQGGPAQYEMHVTCNAPSANNIALSWTKRSDISDFTIVIKTPHSTQAPLVSTMTNSTSFMQTGIPTGSFEAKVEGNYLMNDYPAPGQQTRVAAQAGRSNFSVPLTPGGGC